MVFCEIRDAENCELSEHRKKLKDLCRMCHNKLVKQQTVLIKSLPKHSRFKCKYKNKHFLIMNILKVKNILPCSPRSLFPPCICFKCCSKMASSMNKIIPKLNKVSVSDLHAVKIIADRYWPFSENEDDYFKDHPSFVEENEGEISTCNQSTEIESQFQASIMNPSDDGSSEETNFETDDVVVTPAKSENSAGNGDNEGFIPKNSKR